MLIGSVLLGSIVKFGECLLVFFVEGEFVLGFG